MRSLTTLLFSFSVACCAAQPARIDAPRRATADAQSEPRDGTPFADAHSEPRDGTPRPDGGAVAAERDAESPLPAPRSFAELIEREVPVYWRTQSARGPVCTRWTAQRAGAQGQQRSLSASVTIRCVETKASINVVVRADDLIELNGIGGAVSSRGGGSGWMRSSSANGARVQWLESDEQKVQTSEGPWFFDRAACEAASAEIATSAVTLQPARPPHESVRAAQSVAELRWLMASLASSGSPAPMVAAMDALFRPGASLWEPDVTRRSCRRWSVEQDSEHRARLVRELPGARGRSVVEQQSIRWLAACGDLELLSCVRLHRGPGVGGAEHSSYEGRVSVDDATSEALSVGQLRVFASRAACLRSSARAHGPLFTACDR